MARHNEDDGCPTTYLIPTALLMAYFILVTIALIAYTIINRKYLGAGGIRIRNEEGRSMKRSKNAGRNQQQDLITDYDQTMAQSTEAPNDGQKA
ncbi:hypothetical protein L596_028789 [Steinernema carpocapsae]|uniref:Uncharacterized protein n=1 Tax=Steinernema carpocapsae TaxID=34508 RepID=A0A4U5LZE2_STECR|nr:hypothetical protein L596_028789 [Steinernema carpocapsae]